MKLFTSLALTALLLGAAACGDDSRRGTTDTGTITLMDGGGGDSSAGGDSSTTRPDATTTDGGGGTCPPQMLPPPDMAVCAGSTLTCLMECADEPCVTACFDADPNTDACIACTNDAIIACATTMGCDDEAGQLVCCTMDNCPTGEASCVQSMCSGELMTFETCVNGVAMSCISSVGVCFMSS